MGLLDNVLGGLAGSGGNASPLQGVLMSLLAGQAGQGATGGGMAGALGGMLGGQGSSTNGLAGLIGRFEQAGLGHVAQSWVGTGPNQPVSPQQVESALGSGQVQAMANQTGMAAPDLLSGLAQALPGIIDRLTPQGRLPTHTEMHGREGDGTIEV